MDLMNMKSFHKVNDHTACTSEYINWWYHKMRKCRTIKEANFWKLFMTCGRSYSHYSQLCPTKDHEGLVKIVNTTGKGLCHQLAHNFLDHLNQNSEHSDSVQKSWRIVWGYIDAMKGGEYGNTYSHSFLVTKTSKGDDLLVDPLHIASVYDKTGDYMVGHYGIELPFFWVDSVSSTLAHTGWAYTPHSRYIKDRVLPSERKTDALIELILSNRL